MSFLQDCQKFRELLPELLAEHHGQWAVFKDGEVVTFCDSADDAYKHAREEFGLSAVVVAPVIRDDEASLRLGVSVAG